MKESDIHYLKENLEKLGYSQYLENFIEEEFCEKSFKNLHYQSLLTVIPKAGVRNLFWESYLKLYERGETISEASTLSCTTDSGASSSTAIYTASIPLTFDNDQVDNIYFSTASLENIPTNNLEAILNCANGTIVKQFYNKYNYLDKARRNALANLIISKELAFTKTITSDRFTLMTEEIVQLFPNEIKEIYYVPYNKHTKKIAGGKLYAVYNYLRKKILSTALPNILEPVKEDLISTDGIEFLKSNTEPMELVFMYWKTTQEYRNQLLQSSSINEYFKNFPALEGPNGHILLCQDFDQQYPESKNNFSKLWPGVNEKIKTIARKKKINLEFDFELGGILLLPHILNVAYSKKRKTDRRIKYSVKEISDSFFVHLEDTHKFNETIASIKKDLLEKKETFQPTILFVGDSLENVTASYVIVNNTVYNIEKAINCIDVCFKLIFALSAKYPQPSQLIWTFLQTHIYKIKTVHDGNYTTVNDFIAEISK